MALKDLLRLLKRIRFRLGYALGFIPPVAGGSPEGEGDGGEGDGGGEEGAGDAGTGGGDGDAGAGDAGDAGDGGDEGGSEGEGDGDPEPSGKETVVELKRRLRLAERQGKAASKRDKATIAKLQADLKKREDADKSEQERAIEAAKEEGRNSALAEVQKELRSERLAGAVTRLASKGLTVGEGEEKETVKFADRPTRVMLEQALANEDIDSADIFDDKGRVRDEGLREAVAQMLAEEEHLIVRPASNGGEQKKPPANDAGKGDGAGSKTLEEMSPDEHLKEIRGQR